MSVQKRVDVLIVGQGLAGSLVAFYLEKAGKRVMVVDKQHEGASSKIAAGIVNPITGRRFVKSWMIDELLPVARVCYRELEESLGVKLLYQRSIYRLLDSPAEDNEWQSRSGAAPLAPYIGTASDEDRVQAIVQDHYGICEVKGIQVDLPLLIESYKQYLQDKQALLLENFDYSALIPKENGFEYGNIHCSSVIFCEGHQARQNPWFSYLPFVLTKGEVFYLDLPQHTSEHILKRKVMLAPMSNGQYWLGANYEWTPQDDLPTEKGRQELEEKLKALLHLPYQIHTHTAAIRPTVKDRRPFLGEHTEEKGMYIFNGLGTKGVSLGPYWARHFCRWLIGKEELAREVDIRRFNQE
ncbi:MAG: FAD-binding oxidoreductase [Bacteroidota bacterium]